MIWYADIRDALSDLIKVKAGLPLKVFFNHVNDASESYALVSLRLERRDLGFGWFEHRVRTDIVIHLAPKMPGAEIRASDLYEIAERLDVASLHAIPIADRHITILDTKFVVFDGLGTWSAVLDFSDYYQSLSSEDAATFMEELTLNLEQK